LQDFPFEDLICRALRGDDAAWPAESKPTDADDFLADCQRHGVSGLVFQRMQGQPEWAAWPREVRESLEQSGKAGVAQELLRRHYLSIVLRTFSDRGIRCLLMKGEALATTHYEAPGTRTRGDCDLFIGFRDIEKAKEALLDCDFQVVSPVYKSHQFNAVRAGQKSRSVQFDVHWRISNHPRFARGITFEDAYRHSIELPGAVPTRTLDAVDALLVACMHRLASDRHDANRLIWLYDVHVLVGSMPPAELSEAVRRASGYDLQAALLDGVLRARERFGTEFPQQLLEMLTQSEAGASGKARLADSNLALLADDLRVLPGMRSTLKLIKELFLPPADSLLREAGRTSPLWLPWLYVQQVLGGVAKRLSLR